jgi:hypothetical protein
MSGILSVERMGLLFKIAGGPRRQVQVPQDHDNILLSQIRSPPPGGARPRIYILKEQGGPVIFPNTEFPFRRLLRLVDLYKSQSYLTTDGQ